MRKCVLQDWVLDLSYMQQSVLISGVRGCDGLTKYHPAKYIQRWFRRCFMLSAMDGRALTHPGESNGGSFTGPVPQCQPLWSNTSGPLGKPGEWWEPMDEAFGDYLKLVDEVPHHFHCHLMHGAEILGYHHPDVSIRNWWHKTYLRMVNDMHLLPESKDEMDERLSDNREQWLKRNDPATVD